MNDPTRLDELYDAAMRLPPSQRSAFLDAEAASADPELVARVRERIADDVNRTDTHDLLYGREAHRHAPSASEFTDFTSADDMPKRIGSYRILESIGEGGMGSVFVAEQREPVQRRVALKVIKLGMDTKEVLLRFEAEHRALSLMNHSSIARVFDAGATDDGRPYFVMEYVPGEAITAYADRNRLSIRDRLLLFIQVCRGVHHAHQKAILHRDLKPSNILVAPQDGVPVPKIIDFGVAKATGQRLTEASLYTEIGRLIGTPEYMSPEQAEGADIDTRSDVYSLGVVLYELLTGALPFDSATLRKGGPASAQRMIREQEPSKPSTRVADDLEVAPRKRAERRQSDLRSLARSLRGDLDWITMKCLEKDRTRRYGSADQLAEELERHLREDPVLAGPPSAGYRIHKFVRRNRGAVITLSLLATSGLIAGTVILVLWNRAVGERIRADLKTAEAEALANELLGLSDLERIADAEAELRELLPLSLERLPELRDWSLQPIVSRLDAHVEALERIRSRALVAGGDGRDWVFETPELKWQHDKRAELVARIRAFGDSGLGARVDEWLIAFETSPAAWDEAIQDIRQNPKYGGLELTPQAGLIPLGKNPRTQLWEFWHPQSGARPAANIDWVEDGDIRENVDRWLIDGESGLVFVLIPGGGFWMGAQSEDDKGQNFDAKAEAYEGPVSWVELEPFFISKYEMTQGQWQRLASLTERPVSIDSAYPGAGNPIAPVAWIDVAGPDGLLSQTAIQLTLPTEAQWEYAARAGTSTPYWCGRDASALAQQFVGWLGTGDLDGVGHYRANAFGLHDTIGGVWEYCLDQVVSYSVAPEPGTGLRTPLRLPDGDAGSDRFEDRVIRGGFDGDRYNGRSAARNQTSGGPRLTLPRFDVLVGIRPVQAVGMGAGR